MLIDVVGDGGVERFSRAEKGPPADADGRELSY
jgi:hypothetical protein